MPNVKNIKNLTNLDDTTAEQLVEEKKKSRRPLRSLQEKPQFEDGDNTKYITHSLELANLPNIDTNNPTQVNQRVTEYFTICARNDMKPSVASLALAFGVERTTLWKWANGVEINKCAEVRNSIKKAYAIINAQMEDLMQSGKINPVSGIFLMKNNMGYHDNQEIVVTPNVETPQNDTLIDESKLLPN